MFSIDDHTQWINEVDCHRRCGLLFGYSFEFRKDCRSLLQHLVASTVKIGKILRNKTLNLVETETKVRGALPIFP